MSGGPPYRQDEFRGYGYYPPAGKPASAGKETRALTIFTLFALAVVVGRFW